MARKPKVKFPEPKLTPEEQQRAHCLSKKYGGQATCRSYCTMYETMPMLRSLAVLCSGCGIWSPCPDLSLCRKNVWKLVLVRRDKRYEDKTDSVTLPDLK